MATGSGSEGAAASAKTLAPRPSLKERWEQGATLFKELKRRFPRANYEDYYRIGVWNQTLLETDIEILDQHRMDRLNMNISDPPDLPALEDIPDSALPPPPTRRSQPSLRPGVPTTGRAPPPPRPEDQARRLHDFVERYRLDAMRVKLMFAHFRPEIRAFVMESFRPTSSDKKAATNQLRDFLDDQRDRGWPRVRAMPEPAGRRPVHGGAPVSSAGSRRPAIGGALGRPAPTSRSAPAPPRAPPSRYGMVRGRDRGGDLPSRREPPWAARGEPTRARGEPARARGPGGLPPSSGSKRPAPSVIGAGSEAKRSRYGDRLPTSSPSASKPTPPSRAPPSSARPRTPPRQPKPPPGAPPTRRLAGSAGSSASRSDRNEAASKRSAPSSVVGAKPGDLIKSLLG